jgi:protein O-mannosyl-transferase
MTGRRPVPYLTLLLLAFIAYGPALKTGFLYDDHILIEGNPSLRSWSPETLRRDFSSGVFSAKGGLDFYRPLQILSTRIEYTLFKLNPFPYHMTNLLLHAGSALLLYQLFLLLGFGGLAALLAGALFAVHPIIVEPMLMVSGRGEMLGLFFGLASLLFFLQKKRTGLVWGSAAYVLALLSKEGAVMTPVLLAAAFYYKKEPFSRYRVFFLLGAITVLYIGVRTYALGSLGPNILSMQPGWFFIKAFPVVFFSYVRILLVPFDLHTDRLLPPPGAFWIADALGLVLLAGWTFWRGPRWARFCLLWYLAALLPKTPLMISGGFMSDHWAYPAWPALALPLAMLSARLWQAGHPFRRRIWRGAVVLLLLAETGVVYANIALRNTDEKLYRSALRHTTSGTMRYNLGMVLFNQGRPAEALPYFEAVYAEHPEANAGRALAAAYWESGARARSLALLEDLARRFPDDPLTPQILRELKTQPK